MKEHPEDICECGDYRREHPDNGACSLNGLGHGIPREWYQGCFKFRLSICGGEQGVVVADADENARKTHSPKGRL
jgi:hypothetical protein